MTRNQEKTIELAWIDHQVKVVTELHYANKFALGMHLALKNKVEVNKNKQMIKETTLALAYLNRRKFFLTRNGK